MEKLIDVRTRWGSVSLVDALERELSVDEVGQTVQGICNVKAICEDSWDESLRNYRGVIVYMSLGEYESLHKEMKGGNK
jgi:hypothetical protein